MLSQFHAFFESLRPKQWIKNLLLFAGIIFSGNLSNPQMLQNVFLAFAAFCLLSSSVYLINDLLDREQDRKHPKKQHRPIASGKISPTGALTGALAMAIVALWGSFRLTPEFGLWASVYFSAMVLYSLYFKHVVVVDLLLLAFAYVIRAVAGIACIRLPDHNVELTTWFISCTLFLALFIAICKRRSELLTLSEGAQNHRRVLEEYSLAFLDQMAAVATSSTILSYALYAAQSQEHPYMIFTVPFMLFGIFRYLYLVHRRNAGGEPENVLLSDWPMLLNIVLWLISVILVFYLPESGGQSL